MAAIAVSAIAWLVVIGGAARAEVPVAPGQQYVGGTRVVFSEIGVSLEIPSEWIGTLPPGAEIFLMASNTRPGMILGFPIEGGVAAVAAQMGQPVPIDASLTLVPVAPPTVAGQRVSGRYRAADPTRPIEGYGVAVVGDTGVTVGLLALGPREEASYREGLVDGVAGGLRFAKAAAPAAPAGSGGDWDARLRGRQLNYFSGSSDFRVHNRIALCSDGRFEARFTDSSGGITGYGTARSGGSGSWRIAGASLQLQYGDGSTASYSLERRGEQTFLDGTRWLVGGNDYCP